MLGLAAGAVTALQLAVSPGTGPARADATTGTAGLFVPATGRLLDTRNGTGGYSSPMPAGGVRTVTAAGRAGVPATGVSALALTLTAVGAASIGAVSVAPGDVATPTGTALVFNPGDSVSNTALVALSADGTLRVVADHAVNLIIDVQGYFTAGGSAAPGGFVALDQTRIADTRSGLNLPQARVATGSAITLRASDLDVGVPADASAVYVNIAVLNQSAIGYLRAFAAGAAVPTTGALDFDNTAQALSVTIPLSDDGSFSVLVGAGGPVDLVIDIQGYFTPSAAAGMFTPMAARLLDTRAAPVRTIAGNSVLTLNVADVGGLPTVASGLAAVALNLRTVQSSSNTTAGGYLRLWPSDRPEPVTSSLNYTAANTYRTNLAIVAPSAEGTVSIRNGGSGAIDLVVDAQGWFHATTPATPIVTSSSFTDGQTAALADSSATFTFAVPPGVGTVATSFRYALDDAEPTIVPGTPATVALGVTTHGSHYLLVQAVDANGMSSKVADFYFEIGEDTPVTPVADSPLRVSVATDETVTNEDGSTTTVTQTESSSDSYPATPQQIPGGGSSSPTIGTLSCRTANLRVGDSRGYMNIRNNCPFRVANFSFFIACPIGGTNVTPVFEIGFVWTLNGRPMSKTAAHNAQCARYTYHGTFNPVALGAIVVGSNRFVYSYTRGSIVVNVRITFTVHFKSVP